MLVYTGDKKEFLNDVVDDKIASIIQDNIYLKLKRNTPKNEFSSWVNSLNYMYKVLTDDAIPDNSGVAIEYNIPQTSKRVDFILTGYNKNKESNAIIIELKQWEKINSINNLDGLVETFIAKGMHTVVHPSYQAWSYATLIKDYNKAVQDRNVLLHPCAYLHNYERVVSDPIDEEQYRDYYDEAPVFSRGQIDKLRTFIKQQITTGDNKDILYLIENGKIAPSKSLQNSIANMIKGNKEFCMIDDQKVVFESILDISKKSHRDSKKRTVIIEGGPGTGKTVVAINLLSTLTNDNQFVQYVSKNSAPRSVYLKKLKTVMKKSSVDNMFKGSGIYTNAGMNIVDTILVDEAHRLNAKSGMFKNMGENQIKEIIAASKCSVFFIDEHQKVTTSDIGSIAEIEKHANNLNSQIYHMKLNSQFRCNGSDGYLAWLDNLLEIRETANYDLFDVDFDIKVIDDPQMLHDLIVEKDSQGLKSRLLAGYCWNWIADGKNDSNIHDIQIGSFGMSWNLGNSTTYAIDNSSINEIGCIHTTQGLEFDYVGVIIGDDMSYADGKIVTDFTKRASTDKSLSGLKTRFKTDSVNVLKEADQIIKNTYRTLLTRGMKGCYIYCTNKNLSNYIKERIGNER